MFKGLIDNYRWQAHARLCARRGDLDIVFEKGLAKPRTNQETMHLPLPNPDMTDEERDELLHYVNHESSHHEYSTDFDLMGKETGIIPGKTFKGDIWNAFEDNRVDINANAEWHGVRENADTFYENKMPSYIKGLQKFINNDSFPPEFRDQRSSLLYMALSNDAVTIPAIAIRLEELRATLSDTALEHVKRYEESDYQQRILNAAKGIEGSQEMAKIAIEAEQRIFQVIEEEEEEPEQEGDSDKKEAGKGDPDEETTSSDEDAEGKGQEGELDEGEAGDSGGEGGEGTGGSADKETEEQLIKRLKEEHPDADLQVGDHEESAKEAEGDEEDRDKKEAWEYDESSHVFYPHDLDILQVINYETKQSKNCSYGSDPDNYIDYSPRYVNRMVERIEKKADGKKLSTILRKLLQIRSRKRWMYGKKRGKLVGKSLHRLLIEDGGSYSERVFKQRGDTISLDVALQLVVDYSGSMEGTKMATAIVSANMLCETVSRSLRVPVELLGFSGRHTTRMAVFKSFDVPASSDAVKERMIEATGMMSDNADGEALVWAYTRLIRRREKRKIMIVLSDGQPSAAYRSGNLSEYTKKVVAEIEEKSPVEVIGIGLLDESVKYFYKDNVVINSASELEDALLSIVKSKILEGERK